MKKLKEMAKGAMKAMKVMVKPMAKSSSTAYKAGKAVAGMVKVPSLAGRATAKAVKGKMAKKR